MIRCGSCSVSDFIHAIKYLMEELTHIDCSLSNDDLTFYVLLSLGSEFKEIAMLIHTQDTSITFEELHNILVGHKTYLQCLDPATHSLIETANYANKKIYNNFSPKSL